MVCRAVKERRNNPFDRVPQHREELTVPADGAQGFPALKARIAAVAVLARTILGKCPDGRLNDSGMHSSVSPRLGLSSKYPFSRGDANTYIPHVNTPFSTATVGRVLTINSNSYHPSHKLLCTPPTKTRFSANFWCGLRNRPSHREFISENQSITKESL